MFAAVRTETAQLLHIIVKVLAVSLVCGYSSACVLGFACLFQDSSISCNHLCRSHVIISLLSGLQLGVCVTACIIAGPSKQGKFSPALTAGLHLSIMGFFCLAD